MQNIEAIKYFSKSIRRRIIELTYSTGDIGAHVGGGLSCVDLISTLYCGDYINHQFDSLVNHRDRFILSKGHAAITLFAVLEKIGLIKDEELNTFKRNGSQFYAHAARDISIGIEFSGGSLSLGLSYAVGVALSCKKNDFKNHIYVLIGDGECDEGLIWEASMSAAHYNLDNLTVIVDNNGLQSDGFSKNIMDKSSLTRKFEAFGFNSIEIDGHDILSICKALNSKKKKMPNAIIANTIKGKGISYMENIPKWHHGSLSIDDFNIAMNELK